MSPFLSSAQLFSVRAAMVQAAKKVAQASRLPGSGSKRDACATFLEELIDACVLELYFPEEAAAKDLRFMDEVAALLDVDGASCSVQEADGTRRSIASVAPPHKPVPTKQDASSTISAAEALCSAANAPSHPLRQNLNRLSACNAQAGLESASPGLFAVIQQEGNV